MAKSLNEVYEINGKIRKLIQLKQSCFSFPFSTLTYICACNNDTIIWKRQPKCLMSKKKKKSVSFYHKIGESLQILKYFVFVKVICYTYWETKSSFSFTGKRLFILTCLCGWDTFAFMFIHSDNADIQANGLWQNQEFLDATVLRILGMISVSHFYYIFPQIYKVSFGLF